MVGGKRGTTKEKRLIEAERRRDGWMKQRK